MPEAPAPPGAAAPHHRLGLVGAGRFAHLYHLPAIRQDPRAELTIVCDPAPSPHTISLAAELGVPLVADMAAVLASGVCDAVVISTPHAQHAGQIRAALDAGRHVLVDKPYVMHSDEADALTAGAAERGLIGSVAFNQRFSTAWLRARQLIQGGELGTLRRIETIQLGGAWVAAADGNAPRTTGPLRPAWYLDPAQSGGGVLVGRGAHMADIVPWVVGRRPERLRAQVVAGPAGEVDRGGTADLDFGDLTWRFTTLADTGRLWDDARFYGTNGRIEASKPEGTLGFWDLTREDLEGHRLDVPEPGIDAVALTNFLDALDGIAEPRCTFADAWPSVRILEAIYASAADGGAWVTL
jgi:predicted dehydrogenase